jgi:type I restriction enzyme, S subunit
LAIEEVVGPLPDGWRYVTLAAACESGGGGIQTGPFGSQLHASDYVSTGVPSIMPQNIGDNRIIEDGIARITVEDANRLSRYLVRNGDIVYSRRGDVERRALVREHESGWLCGTGCLRVRFGEAGPDPRFASYYLGHPAVREWIVRHAHGATMPNLNTTILGACPFVLPPMPEHLAVADVLETLDKGIELNRRMSETLETMARALFKSWFVDFDPVRAKTEGRDPGLPEALADLFPARLVDSELGEIPEGWEVKPIGDLAEVVGGATPNTDRAQYWKDGTHHWVTPKDLSRLSMPVVLDTERRITDAGLAQVSSGLLPRGTVLLSSRAPIGYLAIAEVPVAVNQGFIAMKPRQGTSNLFLLRWASAAHDEIVSYANGSTFLEITKASFRPIRTIVPAAPIMHVFDRISRPMYLKTVEHERETRVLAGLRDTLLPKLISGELRIRDAEALVGQAT